MEKSSIKNRKSYIRFKRIFDLIESNKTSEEKLQELFNEMDSMYAFGSQQSANYALEAVNFIIKEHSNAEK